MLIQILIVAYAPTSDQTLTMDLLETYMSQVSFRSKRI
jgi:hypothetical protein